MQAKVFKVLIISPIGFVEYSDSHDSDVGKNVPNDNFYFISHVLCTEARW